VTAFPLPSHRRPLRLLLCAASAGIALLLAPTVAGAAILTIADARATSFHWQLAANYGPTGEGWVTPGSVPAVVYPEQPVDPRAWHHLGLPRLLGLDRRPDGLAWHIEGLALLSGGDAWIGLDGRPQSVHLWDQSWYAKSMPSVVERTYSYDSFDQPPPASPPQPPPDRTGGVALHASYTCAASSWNSANPPLNRKPPDCVIAMALSSRCGSLNHVVPEPPAQP
jgi:hypothetical protein